MKSVSAADHKMKTCVIIRNSGASSCHLYCNRKFLPRSCVQCVMCFFLGLLVSGFWLVVHLGRNFSYSVCSWRFHCALVGWRQLYGSTAYTGHRVNPVLCRGVFVACGLLVKVHTTRHNYVQKNLPRLQSQQVSVSQQYTGFSRTVYYLCSICAVFVQYLCSVCAVFVQYLCRQVSSDSALGTITVRAPLIWPFKA
jgi:uncharacterized membrane protein